MGVLQDTKTLVFFSSISRWLEDMNIIFSCQKQNLYLRATV